MSEEFLAKQDSQFYWFFGVIIFWMISIAVSHLIGRKLKKKSQKKRIVRKFAFANISVFAIYICFTVPYTGFFYDFGTKKEFPKEITSSEQTVDYIKDHHDRIEVLERELKESREELRLLRDHYMNLILFIMIFVLTYGYTRAFDSKNDDKDLTEIKLDQVSKL